MFLIVYKDTVLINSSKEVKRNLEFAPFFSTEKAECEPGERQRLVAFTFCQK